MHSLNNKKALITGGTSGIGLAVAKNFIANGAEVIISGRRSTGEAIAVEIGAKFIHCDITDELAVQAMFQVAEKNVGTLDIVVINAGTAADEGSIEEFSSTSMKELMDVNFNGVFYCLKYAPAHLIDNASIIATGSVAGSGVAHAGAGVYAASKAAVAYICRTSAIENAPRGIRVNTVCPAMIAGTGMMTEDDGSNEAQFLANLTAFGRMGKQDEVTGIYNFLASNSATFITGQEIRVDGGVTAGIGLPIFAALS
ncbi:SDR family oxidoreductase [Porticoccaceae bacterium]|nr:SDR family oxidoreductase [Porticoccaceae bacterium]